MCNYFFNRYRLFDYDKQYLYGNVNERFVKMAYVIEHKDEFDGFLFGSSRVAKINTTLLPGKVFNFGCNSCSAPEEWLRDIKIMIDNDVSIRKIYLGLDDLFLKDSADRTQRYIELNHYVTGLEKAKYYMKVLMKVPDFKDIKMQIKNDFSDVIKIDLNNGMTVVPEKIEVDIENDKFGHIKSKKFKKSHYYDDKYARLESAISSLEEINWLCEVNNIDLVIFFNPVHVRTYVDNDIYLLNEGKKRVAKIKPYYDFSGINFITTNNYFWYETSHPRAFVGDYMMNVLTGKNLETVPKYFGDLVTADNINLHLQKKVIERTKWLAKENYTQYIPSVEDKYKFH